VQPDVSQPEVQEAPEQKLEAGTEALQPVEKREEQQPEEMIELKWGREERTAKAQTFNELASQLEASPDALRTWLQMGRDADRVYRDSLRREQDANRKLEEERARWEADRAKAPAPVVPQKRRSVADDPIAFWDEVATKLDKLDRLDRFERLEQMLETTVKNMDIERQQYTQMELENEYVQEHGRFMKEMEGRGRPFVSAEDLAQTIDRYIKEAPDGTTMREIIEAGYKIASYDRTTSATPKPMRPRPAPVRVLSGPTVNTSAEQSDGAQKPNETLDERRARLHKAVGGIRVGDVTGAFDG
jgi:hypothetical protein